MNNSKVIVMTASVGSFLALLGLLFTIYLFSEIYLDESKYAELKTAIKNSQSIEGLKSSATYLVNTELEMKNEAKSYLLGVSVLLFLLIGLNIFLVFYAKYDKSTSNQSLKSTPKSGAN